MLPGEKAAIMEIYAVLRSGEGVLFDSEAHQTIDKSWHQEDADLFQRIHELRVYAEASISKPVMKKYKAMLREGLFG